MGLASLYSAIALLATMAATLLGCAPIPVAPAPVSLDRAEVSFGDIEALRPDEAVAIVWPNNYLVKNNRFSKCVYDSLAIKRPHFKIIDGDAFAELYPWSDQTVRTLSEEVLVKSLEKPELAKALLEANLRYVMEVSGASIDYQNQGGVIVYHWTDETTLTATLWDFVHGDFLGEIDVDTSGTGGMIYMGFGVYAPPPETWFACHKMAQALKAILTGDELPSDFTSRAQAEAAKKAKLLSEAKKGNYESARRLGESFRVIAPLREIALAGHTNAAITLADEFGDDEPLRTLAERGDFAAARSLAWKTGNQEPLRALARQGNADAALRLYLVLREDNPTEAWTWLCETAKNGNAEAQYTVGRWLQRSAGPQRMDDHSSRRQMGVFPDDRLAYLWYTLAAGNGHEEARHSRAYLLERIPEIQRAQADQMAPDWQPGGCTGRVFRKADLIARTKREDTSAAVALAQEFDDLEPLESLAKDGDREAIYAMAKYFREYGYLEAFAKNGDRVAASALAQRSFKHGYLSARAEKGNFDAAVELMRLFKESGPLNELAEKGNLEAAYILYQHLKASPGELANAWERLCQAANGELRKAQASVGYWHRHDVWKQRIASNEKFGLALRDLGVIPNNRIAYMWYTLAISNGTEYVFHTLARLGKRMTTAEIAQAQQMARDWKPGDCPSAEHRLGPPGET